MNAKKGIKKAGNLILMIGLMFFCCGGRGMGTEFYVATGGNDITGDGSISNPWATPEKAWYTADAGDTVYFRGGTYNITSEIDTKFNGHDGTQLNPITFKNYPEEKVIFNCGILDPVFDIERNWNIIDGIDFDGGRTVFRVGYNNSAVHFTVKNCTAHMALSIDNHGFVYVAVRAENATVQNCLIEGPGSGSNTNVSGIIIFCAPGFKALNNEIYNIPRGIYYKHANAQEDSNIEIAYNYIHDTGHQAMFFNCNYADIHDNLIGLNNGSVVINSANGVSGGDYNIFRNNTLYNCDLILDNDDDGALYNTIQDNIIGQQGEYHRYGSQAHHSTLDNNLYCQSTAVYELGISYNLVDWQTHSSHDQNSLTGTPAFVGGALPSSIADFALTSGSIGKNAASDGKDMGADIDLVGIKATNNPVILSVNQSGISHGDSITITGSEFGIKTTAFPLIWENFEWGTDGDSLSNGGWSSDNFPEIDTAQKYGMGTRSAYNDLYQSSVEQTEFGGAWKSFSESDKIYLSYILRWDHEGGTPSNWGMIKTARLCGLGGIYNVPPSIGTTYFPYSKTTGEHHIYYDPGDGLHSRSPWTDYPTMKDTLPADVWNRIELYIKLSDPPGESNGKFEASINTVKETLGWDGIITRIVSETDGIDSFLTPHMWVNAELNKHFFVWCDDIYIDNTQARVEIGNNSSWKSCTHREIQIPTAWSDNSITINVNQGSFSDADTGYLFVVNGDASISNGYSISFIGGSPVVSGDMNNDGEVNIQDVQLCVNVILGTENNSEIVQKAKEVAEPRGICNELDVQEIVKIILNQ